MNLAITIRDKQLRALGRAAEAGLIRRVARWLREAWPESIGHLHEEILEALAGEIVRLARSFGFEAERDLCRFANLWVALAPNFPDPFLHHWAFPVLEDRSLSPAKSLDALWAEALKRRRPRSPVAGKQGRRPGEDGPDFSALLRHVEVPPASAGGPEIDLRPVVPEDADRVQELVSDPDVARGAAISHSHTDGASRWVRDQLEARARGRALALAITTPGRGLVGVCVVSDLDPRARSGRQSYWIGRSEWGQGYATAAAARVLAYAADTLGLERIDAHALASNVASRRVLDKLSFQFVRSEPAADRRFDAADAICHYEWTLAGAAARLRQGEVGRWNA